LCRQCVDRHMTMMTSLHSDDMNNYTWLSVILIVICNEYYYTWLFKNCYLVLWCNWWNCYGSGVDRYMTYLHSSYMNNYTWLILEWSAMITRGSNLKQCRTSTQYAENSVYTDCNIVRSNTNLLIGCWHFKPNILH
jgi:hypothetical protein